MLLISFSKHTKKGGDQTATHPGKPIPFGFKVNILADLALFRPTSRLSPECFDRILVYIIIIPLSVTRKDNITALWENQDLIMLTPEKQEHITGSQQQGQNGYGKTHLKKLPKTDRRSVPFGNPRHNNIS